MYLIRLTFTLLLCISLLGCTEINTNDPTEVYKSWSGSPPSDKVIVLNGKYWQSSHFTKEYELYLQMRVPETWWNDFVEQNGLTQSKTNWKIQNAPSWFHPNPNSVFYKEENDFGSIYAYDFNTKVCFIYEAQY